MEYKVHGKMSKNIFESLDPATDKEFHQALDQLIREAYSSGITIEGGWACQDGRGDQPDWDVEIVRLQKQLVRDISEGD